LQALRWQSARKQWALRSALALCLGFLLVACHSNRQVQVDSGTYTVSAHRGALGEAVRETIRRLTIDRDRGLAAFCLADGTEVFVPFAPPAQTDWPAGCPTNIGVTFMEVLDLGVEPMPGVTTAFQSPILVRNCPPNPVEVVLRADGDIGGNGNACGSECVFFQRR
jgi:hypothetical protein